jgi:hypothetical protein
MSAAQAVVASASTSSSSSTETKFSYKFTQIIADKIKRALSKETEPDDVMSIDSIFHVGVTNVNDVDFKYLNVTYFMRSKMYNMRLCLQLCCANADCDEDEELNHTYVLGHGDTLDKCYSMIMNKMHYVFNCRKCREATLREPMLFAHSAPLNEEKSETREELDMICNNCLLHEDSYQDQSPNVKKRKLFDCYVCGEEKINKKFKAELKCSGASKHSDELCKFCFKKNASKCPQCKD